MKVDAKSESKWLAADDFEEGRDHILTIQDVSVETVGRGEKAENKYVVHFKEEKKGLTLNAGNRKRIIAMYGDESDDWIGRKVALYLVDTEYEGNPCKGMRIRDKTPSESGRASGRASGGPKDPPVPTLQPNAVARLQERSKAEGFDIETVGLWLREKGRFGIPAPAIASTWAAVCGPKIADAIKAVLDGWKPGGAHEPMTDDDIPF